MKKSENYAVLRETPERRAHFSSPGSYLVLYENAECQGIGIKTLKISLDRNAGLLSKNFLSVTLNDRSGELCNRKTAVETVFKPESISSTWKSEGLHVSGRYFFLDMHTLQFAGEIGSEVSRDDLSIEISGDLVKDIKFGGYCMNEDLLTGHAMLKSPDYRSTMPFHNMHWAFLSDRPLSKQFSDSDKSFRCVLTVGQLKAGEIFKFNFIIPFAMNNPGFFRERLTSARKHLASAGKNYAVRQEEAKRFFDGLPPLESKLEKWRMLYEHAVTALMNNTLKPSPLEFNGGSFGSHTGCYPCKGGYDGCWYWDSAFHVAALSRFAPDLARDNAEIHLENINPDGAAGWILPNTSWKNGDSGFGHVNGITSQPPFMTWALGKYYSHTGDRDFIAKWYPKLITMHRWWYSCRDADQSGLCEYRNGFESGLDNSSRWLFQDGKRVVADVAMTRAQLPTQHLKAVDLNSFLLIEKRTLANFADILGDSSAAASWRKEADKLAGLIIERHYDPDRNIFVDYDYKRKLHSPVLAISSFMPLWAGVPLAKEKAHSMLENYLLNKEYFYGEYPFPSVAFNDPDFDPKAMWRGGIWMNFNYFAVRAMRRYGLDCEITAVKNRIFKYAFNNPSIGEWYDAFTGETLSKQEFGWTSAFLIELLFEK